VRHRRLSIQTSLGLTVLVMGLLGVALSIITGEIYQRLALDNQRNTLEELVKIKVDDILQDVIKQTVQFGLSIQTDTDFRNAIVNEHPAIIQHFLDEQFQRYYFTKTVLKLEKMIVFDQSFAAVVASSEGSPVLSASNVPCPEMLDQAQQRTGAERLKVLTRLCATQDKPVIAVLTPIGGLKIIGYLMIAVDPVLNLSNAEKYLNMPLTVSTPSGTIIYESTHWRTRDPNHITLSTPYAVTGTSGRIVYQMHFLSDVDELNNMLQYTRRVSMGAAAIITLVTALLSILLLQKTALKPLHMLTQQLRLVRKDKAHLGERVEVSGNVEIKEMADVFNDMTVELNILYKTLESMAFTDSLTGLPNRALLYQRLEQAVNNTRTSNQNFFLIMLDLDRFKYINDTLGHHIGDQFLQEVGTRLQQSIRATDTIARLGGDEFAAIVACADYNDAGVIVAEKIIKSLNHPIKIGQYNLSASCSIGLVHCPTDGDNINQLMQHADVAMYHAKKHRHGYVFYEPDLDRHSVLQLNMETELYDAMKNGELHMLYQPKVDLHKGTTVAVEALLRWDHPERGNILPEEFIPLAEHSGLIHMLTKWVIETSLAECAQWHQQNLNIGLAINLSARSLEDAKILDTIQHAINNSGVDPQFLSVELTETTVMSDPMHAMVVLGKLDLMGVNIAIDDFGTGYSSLAYLKKLPVTEIKIDKSFIIDMLQNPSDEVIVRSTIDLGHNMGLDVTAEGVEDEATLKKLVEMGCDLAQGHQLCVPRRADELSQWLTQSRWGLPSLANRAG